MTVRIKVEGKERLLAKLRALASSPSRGSARFDVTFSADHAVAVHENLTAYHAQGQAKFLETPARSMRAAMGATIRNAVRQGVSLREASRQAAEDLLAAAKAIVPVDTGELRNSGRVVERAP